MTDDSRRSLRPRAIVFAYACEPRRGSEPGAGWGVVQALSRVADCTVLVGPEHEGAIRKWETESSRDDAPRFVFVPDGGTDAREGRGRLAWFRAYLRWLKTAELAAKALHVVEPFDVACHATYSTFWLPSPVASLGVPSVWGPVGGGVATPASLWPLLGISGVIEEMLDWTAVRICAMLPATRRTALQSTVCLVQNEATRRLLPVSRQPDARILNHALFVDVPPATNASRQRDRNVLFVGALERRKGCALALRALARTPDDLRLTVVGDGPQRQPLQRLARRIGVAQRVQWLGRVERGRLLELLDRAAATLFTGLREEGGLALAEAMTRGTPVIVLAHGGARAIAECASDMSRVALVESGSLNATEQSLASAMTQMVATRSAPFSSMLDRSAAERALGEAVHGAMRRQTKARSDDRTVESDREQDTANARDRGASTAP